MSEGYVRLWRKSIDGGLIRNHNVWIFWTWCLMKANHEKDYKQVVGFQEVILQPGDFIFGRKKAAEETALSEQNIRTCLSFLKKSKNLTIKPTNKFSIISIINWSVYQFIKDDTNQQTNQHVTSNQPASNHKQEPLNNRTIKEEKKKIKKKLEFTDYLQEKIIENSFFEIKDKIFEFYQYRQEMPSAKRYKSEKGINGLFRNLNECRNAGLIISDCIEIAMEKNWLSFEPSYFKNNGFDNKPKTIPGTTMTKEDYEEFINGN